MWLDRAVKFLLPREDQFFDLLDRGADQLRLAGALLEQCCKATTPAEREPIIAQVRDVEHASDGILREVYDALNKTFVTPIDRADIYDLANRSEDAVDLVHACVAYLPTHDLVDLPAGSAEIAAVVNKQALEMSDSLKRLRHLRDHELIRAHCMATHKLESEADQIFNSNMAALFKKEKEAARLIMSKEFLERLEYAADMMDHLAKSIENVVIKNA